jgi:hypothetical protein
VDRAGPLDDLGGEPPLAGLEDPAIGIREASEGDGQQFVEGALGLVEPCLEVPRRLPEGRDDGVARRRHGAARIAQQRLAGGAVVARDPPGGQEHVGLARAQAVAHDGLGEARLLGAREGGKALRGRRREPTRIDVRSQDRREPTPEDQAALHPAAAAAEQLGDLGGREVIVVGQRADHAGLIHGAQGSPRGVRLEQPGFADDAGGVFDHHRHVRVAAAGPLGEALEAVEHFVAAGAGRGHAQGQRGERARGIGARPPQRRECGGQLIDRDVEHEGHGRGASTGRS